MSDDPYELGKQAWRDGAPEPPRPPDGATDDEIWFHIGFIVARSKSCDPDLARAVEIIGHDYRLGEAHE